MKKRLLIPLIYILLISCEKEIVIDLNKNNPKFVIEGNLSNKAGESKVKISQTLNFDASIPYPAIRGANVTITDNTVGKTDTLVESKAGIYTKAGLAGKDGHKYTLRVKIGVEIFTAASIMPHSVLNYYLVQENPAEQNIGPGPREFIQITPHYSDTSKSIRYYQFLVSKNNNLNNDVFIRSETAEEISYSSVPIWLRANKNDTVSVDMQCIDKAVYTFLFGLTENIYQSTATPSNPTSNISNGALGFFKAHTSQKKSLIIE